MYHWKYWYICVIQFLLHVHVQLPWVHDIRVHVHLSYIIHKHPHIYNYVHVYMYVPPCLCTMPHSIGTFTCTSYMYITHKHPHMYIYNSVYMYINSIIVHVCTCTSYVYKSMCPHVYILWPTPLVHVHVHLTCTKVCALMSIYYGLLYTIGACAYQTLNQISDIHVNTNNFKII